MNDDEIKRKLHEYTSGNSAKQNDAEDNGIVKFDKDHTGVKNICFVLLDGKRIFLNYSYLVAGEFFSEENKIVLHFTTHEVTLKGHNIEKLYFDFLEHTTKLIEANNDRYKAILPTATPLITHISVK